MARKDEYGRIILSAGEIGAFTVCPESWRLKAVKRIKAKAQPNAGTGKELHSQWAQSFEDAVYFSRSVKLIIIMIILVISLYAFT